jgi:hypothetical protein
MDIKDLFEFIAAIAIIFAVGQIWINRKQLFLSTIAKCIADYRSLTGLNKTCQDETTIAKYIDLCNEELFYFKHRYLPLKVAYEWIDGMVNYMPIRDKKGNVLNPEHCLDYLIEHFEVFNKYPRILACFEVIGKYDFELIYDPNPMNRKKRQAERKKLTLEIVHNNQIFEYF